MQCKSWGLVRIPLRLRADRVGSLSNKKRQPNTETFEDTSILHSLLMVANTSILHIIIITIIIIENIKSK
jgi:hypothetical protein